MMRAHGRHPAARHNGPERSPRLSAQTQYLEVDAIGVFPTAVLVLLLVLAALGIVAHAAAL